MKKLLLILLCLPMIGCFDVYENIEAGEKGVLFKRLEKGLDIKEQQEEIMKSLEMEIKSDSTELSKLKNDSEEQERFAREKFLMKKDNEDVFIIRDNKDD